jgi:hypothetical protein
MYYQTQQLYGFFGGGGLLVVGTSRRMRPIQFAHATLALGARPFAVEPLGPVTSEAVSIQNTAR